MCYSLLRRPRMAFVSFCRSLIAHNANQIQILARNQSPMCIYAAKYANLKFNTRSCHFGKIRSSAAGNGSDLIRHFRIYIFNF